MSEQNAIREMTLPGSALVTLRRSLRSEAGPLATVHALHAAGYETGRALASPFLAELRGVLDDLPAEEFWHALRDFCSSRGWGSLEHHDAHPAVGLLTSTDWVEASDGGTESQPSCAFTSGLLAGMLGEVATGPIAVLEVRCRSHGDADCAFAFGGEESVHNLYGALLEGADFAEATAAL